MEAYDPYGSPPLQQTCCTLVAQESFTTGQQCVNTLHVHEHAAAENLCSCVVARRDESGKALSAWLLAIRLSQEDHAESFVTTLAASYATHMSLNGFQAKQDMR
jgi:hypothetical protein